MAGGTGCSSEKGKRYFSADEKFSIAFPKAWKVREGVKGTIFLAELPTEGELSLIKQNVNVLVEETKVPVSLGNYVDLQVAILNRLKGIKTFSRNSAVINGIPVLWFFYSYTIQDFGYKAVVYSLTGNNKKFYVITGIAEFNKFNKYETLFHEAAHSFRFE